MILYEGLFYGLTGGVIGAVSGSASTYAIYSVLSETVGLAWRLPLGVSITAIIVSVLISFLSALLPLKKIGQDDLIENIRMG